MPTAPTSSLRQACDVVLPEPLTWLSPSIRPWTLQHVVSKRFPSAGNRNGAPWDLGPFQESTDEYLHMWAVPIFLRPLAREFGRSDSDRSKLLGRFRMSAAVYVISKGEEPTWHQLVFEYEDSVTGLSEEKLLTCLRIEPVQRRPTVSFEFLPP